MMRRGVAAVFDRRQVHPGAQGVVQCPRRGGRGPACDNFWMHRLRTARLFARLVLAWFVLATGVAIASPLVQPQASALVCSIGGVMKLLPVGDDADAAPSGAVLLDCPLCLQMAAPPVQAPALAARAPASPRMSVQAAPLHVARAAGPAPGRGPPAHT